MKERKSHIKKEIFFYILNLTIDLFQLIGLCTTSIECSNHIFLAYAQLQIQSACHFGYGDVPFREKKSGIDIDSKLSISLFFLLFFFLIAQRLSPHCMILPLTVFFCDQSECIESTIVLKTTANHSLTHRHARQSSVNE
jgi:hypothetical protein